MRSYIKEGIVEQVRAAGGEIYAITSEPQRLADRAREDWELNFEVIGDPHHDIVETCRQRGWLELFINTETELLLQGRAELAHPKGYFQPGVLALNPTGQILYRWRGVPTRRNMGGATERPTPSHVWRQLNDALADPQQSTDAPLDTTPELDSRGIPWPLFLSLLIANGWFIKPQTFGYVSGGLSVVQRVKRAALRLLLFSGVLVAAFTLLPPLLVGAALVAWGAWLTPHVRFFNKQFQNVKIPDPL